jgi:hypothetical protein
MFERDWIMFSNANNHSTLNNEHNSEDLCNQVRNQQTCTFDRRNQIREGPSFFVHISHCRFANTLPTHAGADPQ